MKGINEWKELMNERNEWMKVRKYERKGWMKVRMGEVRMNDWMTDMDGLEGYYNQQDSAPTW